MGFKEPVFKLLMQPYFEQMTKVMDAISKIGATFRYMMLPNALLMAIATMGHVPECNDLYFYVMDMYLGQIIYFWCLFDLVLTALLFLFFQVVYQNRVIGTWAYTIYKVWWFLSTPLTFVLFIADLCFVVDLAFWRGIYFSIVLAFNFEFRLSFFLVVDITQLAAELNAILDTLQIVILILGLVCPKCGGRLPVVGKWIKEDELEDQGEEDTVLLGSAKN